MNSVFCSSYELYDFLFLQMKRLMESDAAMTEDLIAYNIIPLDAPSMTNAIGSLVEVFQTTIFLFGI